MKPKITLPLFLVCLTSVAVFARPPKVIKMYPENGAVDVPPGLIKIRILFDQDMTGGKNYSLCGGGENFPEITGTPQWTGKRSFVFSAILKPIHDYSFGINCPSAGNFKSVTGESAENTVVQFRTMGSDESPSENSAAVSNEQNQQAVQKLREAIENAYAYKDMKNINWDELFNRYNDSLLKSATPMDFAKTAGLLLAHAKDKHIWLMVGEQHVSAYKNPVTPNANFELLPKLVPNFKKHNANICTGKFPDGIGYIYIDSWNRQQKEDFDQLYVALSEFSDSPGLIIDVRGNGGGAEPLAQEFAGCFIDEPKLYAKHITINSEDPNHFTKPQERYVQPNKTRPHYRGKVAVLVGPVVMSSCESFVLMMKQVPNCTIIGEPTQGSSGNPKPHDLGNGVTVYLPSWKDLLPDETCFEGKGIQPDILIKVQPNQITSKDSVIEAALRELRQRR
ncbi:MAG: S41 family peptidase [Planctomycetales bacterium]|nr:S41 family peptidase [Planctomycetales bacterium]